MHLLSVINSDVLVEAIEKEIAKLGRDLSNVELNDLVNRLIKDGKATLLHAQKEKMDGDLLAGNLREDGYKVTNLNEEIRKKRKDDTGTV